MGFLACPAARQGNKLAQIAVAFFIGYQHKQFPATLFMVMQHETAANNKVQAAFLCLYMRPDGTCNRTLIGQCQGAITGLICLLHQFFRVGSAF